MADPTDPWEALITRILEGRAAPGVPYEPMRAGAMDETGSPAAIAPPAAAAVQQPAAAAPFSLGAFFRGASQNASGIIPDLIRGANRPEIENLTAQALKARGMSDADIQAAVRNPDMMKMVLGQAFGPKLTKVEPEAALVNNQGKLIFRNETQKMPDLVKDYNFYSQQERGAGREPKSFSDWDLMRRQAGATAITIDQKGEAQFAKEVGTQQAKRFNELVERGSQSRTIISDLDALREIGARIPGGTGKTAEIIAALGPYADALGVKIEGLDDIQAYRAITSRLAPRMRAPDSGATSDFEMRTFLDALPNLGRTPGGNEIVANVYQALEEHHIRAAEIASKAMERAITPAEAERQLRALPDPFKAWTEFRRRSPAATPGATPKEPQPGTPAGTRGTSLDDPVPVERIEDALKLPKGTFFKTPDGRVKVR